MWRHNYFGTYWAPDSRSLIIGGNTGTTVGLWPVAVGRHDILQRNAFRGTIEPESIYKDAGQGPGEDVMSGVEYLKRRGLIDPARMAVTGWIDWLQRYL